MFRKRYFLLWSQDEMLSLIERDPTSVFFSFENISGASNVAHHALQENFVHSPKNTNQNQTNPAYAI